MPLNTTLKSLDDMAQLLLARGETLSAAESCTSGLICAALTSLPGSSGWFKGGIIAYANEIKAALLGVPEELIAAHGAVSEAVALAMAGGACAALRTSHSLAVTGIAGPDGGTPEKPVGTVWLAWSVAGRLFAEQRLFTGHRAEIRSLAAQRALTGLLERLSD